MHIFDIVRQDFITRACYTQFKIKSEIVHKFRKWGKHDCTMQSIHPPYNLMSYARGCHLWCMKFIPLSISMSSWAHSSRGTWAHEQIIFGEPSSNRKVPITTWNCLPHAQILLKLLLLHIVFVASETFGIVCLK